MQASDGSEADTISLRWNASAGADEYRVYRSTSLTGIKTAVSDWIAPNSFDDLTANSAVTYYYWVKARNTVGESGFSAPDTGWRMPQSPMNMTRIGGYDLGSEVFDVFVRDDLAYVGASRGLFILDVSDPTSPTHRGERTRVGGRVFDVFVAGDVAYLSLTQMDLATVNVSDPAAPSAPSYISPSAGLPDVHVHNNLLYTAGGSLGLVIYDLLDPMSPGMISQTFTFASGNGIFPTDNVTYVSGGTQRGLIIYDTTDPTSPTEIGFLDTPGQGHDVHVENDIAYVADGDTNTMGGPNSGGLQIIDVADPTNPYHLYTFDTPGAAIRLYVSDGVVFIADGESGVEALGVQNPELPRLRGYYDTDGQANSVFVVGDLVFVADGTNGLVILRLDRLPSLAVKHPWFLYR